MNVGESLNSIILCLAPAVLNETKATGVAIHQYVYGYRHGHGTGTGMDVELVKLQ